MPHIIYIHPEEEITSLISRLRRCSDQDLVLVVPQRAIILESLINLQLLKKEMDAIGKHIAIATQDSYGVSCVERAGIEKAQSNDIPTLQQLHNQYEKREAPQQDMKVLHENFNGKTNGVSRFSSQEGGKERHIRVEEQDERRTQNKKSLQERKNRPMSDGIRVGDGISARRVVSQPIMPTQQNRQHTPPQKEQEDYTAPVRLSSEHSLSNTHSQTRKSQKEEPQYSSTPSAMALSQWHWHRQEKADEPNTIPVRQDSKQKKVHARPNTLLIVAIASFIVLIGVGSFVWKYIPKTAITVYLTEISATGDMNVMASVSDGKGDVAMEIFSDTITLKRSVEATGSEDAGTRRSTGRVIIYNNYSEASQPLVATTRLLTEDGKLFRLTQSVVVPGKNGDTPGSVEALVKADEAGEAYNIEPSRFSIPGLQGTSKYDGFYAQSEEKFVGGGMTEGGVKIVSDEDIANARQTLESEVNKEAIRLLEKSVPSDFHLFSDTLEVTIESSDVFPGAGTVAETFEYSIIARVRAIAIKESDLEMYAQRELFDNAKKNISDADKVNWRLHNADIQYGKVTANYDQENMEIKFYAELLWKAGFDEEVFKKKILGKSTDELESLLEESPELEKIDIETEPASLFSGVSSVPSRVEIKVE